MLDNAIKELRRLSEEDGPYSLMALSQRKQRSMRMLRGLSR
jgi:hypothetical protein